jgi:hypothetical protein
MCLPKRLSPGYKYSCSGSVPLAGFEVATYGRFSGGRRGREIRTSHSTDMPTMRSVIVKARRGRLSYVRRWNRGLRNASYNCIRRRPRSFTARTQIVWGSIPNGRSTFFGYPFRPRGAVNRKGERFIAFLPAVSNKATKKMRCRVRRWRLHRRNDLELEEIARRVRPVLTGWERYYGRFYPSKLQQELRTIDAFIVRWAIRKYKRFQGHTMATWDWLRSVKRRTPGLFAHGSLGPTAR